MRILLDTRIALWAIADTSKLSDEVTRLLESRENDIFYSLVSVWEIAIKHQINPKHMPIAEEIFVQLCENTGFVKLPVKSGHIFLLKTLVRPEDAPKHKDPFDRLLLAQAKYEGFKFFTHDSLIPYYEESCIISV